MPAGHRQAPAAGGEHRVGTHAASQQHGPRGLETAFPGFVNGGSRSRPHMLVRQWTQGLWAAAVRAPRPWRKVILAFRLRARVQGSCMRPSFLISKQVQN